MARAELSPVQFVNIASAPSSPTEGWVYYNTVTHALTVWNGTSWVTLGAAGTPASFSRLFAQMGA